MEEQSLKSGASKGGHHYREAKKVTLVSVGVNVVLTALQIVVGIIGKSQALVADGLHSLSDLLCDFLVLFANRHGSKDADKDHPYGHARIETATTFVLGVILMGTGAALLWGAAQRLEDPAALQTVHVMTLWIAILTLVGKESLFRYMLHVARKLRSRMLEANAWHARSDAASSVVVVVGIAGNLAGVTSLDLLAAALVAAMIFRMGWKQAYHALMELIDTSLDEKDVAAIRATLLATPGVRDLHELRTRRMGDRALVDAHVLVDPKISVSEGHYVAETARARVVKTHDALDVMIHIDPEDDSAVKRSLHLPPRETLLAHLEQQMGMPLPLSSRITLHYLDGRVEADIFLPGPAPDEAFTRAAVELPGDDTFFGAIRIFYEVAPK
ncbi:MAG: cation diffusion facilitator family transporter [Sulfurimicrobium sp.]|uniref:cation diffusion facilitator family transporter n=1 Tax=Polaromonas sp. TaxID=1869339 RepID=UPI002719F3C2|nr:cation diffusion facilitator family transporter [Polaromonas sp.]MDO8890758.1 cation diffusion facilitator family transporter [Sulfurimicrobium sp.]MDP1885005.1 cation diffusion facilitator family transporter [Polaromonas sp.]MDP2199629.1 cation diffusion facilitator family transporter [Sulfurimicrobium sp.]